MPQTPDRDPGTRLEEDIVFSSTADPTVDGGQSYTTADGHRFRHGGVVRGLGLTAAEHAALDSLTHDLAEDAFLEVTRTSGRVSNITVYTDSGKTTKIRELEVTRTSGLISSLVTKQYDGAGALLVTLTESVTRSSGRVVSVTSAVT